MKIKVKEKETLLSLLKSLIIFKEPLTFTIDETGINTKRWNTAKTFFLDLLIPAEILEYKNEAVKLMFSVDTEELLGAANQSKKEETMDMELTKGFLKIEMKKIKNSKVYELPLGEKESKHIGPLEYDFSTRIELETQLIHENIAYLRSTYLSDLILLDTDQEKLRIRTCTKTNGKIKLGHSYADIYPSAQIDAKERCLSIYRLNDLYDIILGCKDATDQLLLCYSQNKPLLIESKLISEGRLRWWLVPPLTLSMKK